MPIRTLTPRTMTLRAMSAPKMIERGAAETVPFDLTQVSGKVLWFPSTKLALADLAAVSSWPDQSGLANDATQVGGARPVFKVNQVNALPAVRFLKASVQYLKIANAASLSITAGFTLYFVMAVQTSGVTQVVFTRGDSVRPMNPIYVTSTNKFGASLNDGAYNINASGVTVTTGVYQIWSVTYIPSVSYSAYINGALNWTDASPPAAITESAQTSGIGGDPTSGGNPCSIDVAEILMTSPQLSSAVQKQVNTYLGTKFGITVS